MATSYAVLTEQEAVARLSQAYRALHANIVGYADTALLRYIEPIYARGTEEFAKMSRKATSDALDPEASADIERYIANMDTDNPDKHLTWLSLAPMTARDSLYEAAKRAGRTPFEMRR